MKFCVIGVGRFGFQVATTLAENGMEVLAVDSNESIIASIRDRVTHAICMRINDEQALRTIGIEDMNTVIVAMGENFAQSILVTALLKQKLQARSIIARAVNEIHKEILQLVGADQVVLPEQEMGARLADMLSLPFKTIVRIGSDFAISEQQAPERFIGKTIKSLNLPETYNVQCLGKKTDNIVATDPHEKIEDNDLLLLAGSQKDLNRIANL